MSSSHGVAEGTECLDSGNGRRKRGFNSILGENGSPTSYPAVVSTHMELLDMRSSTLACRNHFYFHNLNGGGPGPVPCSHVTVWREEGGDGTMCTGGTIFATSEFFFF